MKLLSSKGIYNSDELMTLSEILEKVLSNCNKKKAFGSNIYINDALNWRNQGIAVGGNTTQVQTEGKNKLNVVGTKTENGVTSTGTSDGKIVCQGTCTGTFFTISNDNIPVNLPAGTYTFSINNPLPFGVVIRFKQEGIETNKSISAGNTSVTATISNPITYLRLYAEGGLSSGTTINATFYPMLEAGSTATAYEPYTGGPTPRPDYPQPLVDATGTQEIETSNKNLFIYSRGTEPIVAYNVTTTPVFKNGLLEYLNVDGQATGNMYLKIGTVYVSPNTDYYISGCPAGGSSSTYEIICYYHDKNGTYIGGVHDYGSGVILNDSQVAFVDIYVLVRSGVSVSNLKFKPQVELGSTATPYVPHKEQNTTLHLGDIHLRKIGNYQDVIFCNEEGSPYYDGTLDEDAWYLLKNCYNETFNGNSIATKVTVATASLGYYYTIPTTKRFRYVNTQSALMNLKCNRFISVINSVEKFENGKISMSASADKVIFGFEGTEQEFQTYRSNNSIDIAYVLATAEKVKITDTTLLADLAELEKMQTYKGGTVISVTPTTGNPAQLEVTYLKDDRVEQAEEISNIKSALLSLGAEI